MFTVILLTLFYVELATTSPIENGFEGNFSQYVPGALLPTPEMIAEVGYKDVVYNESEPIPQEFDARVKWPHCVSLTTIWDQCDCSACWAISSASAMGDRYCIRSQEDVLLSAYDIMSCCKECAPNHPCEGGYPHRAWDHWNKVGVVTGGPVVCGGCSCFRYENFVCDHKCNQWYKKSYESDLTHGHPLKFLKNNSELIQREVMTNGPVVAVFEVFEDFYNVGKEVYIHRYGTSKGYNAVRVIGWGVQNQGGQSVPYWTIAESLGERFADGGYVRFLRGSNHCNIESYMVAD